MTVLSIEQPLFQYVWMPCRQTQPRTIRCSIRINIYLLGWAETRQDRGWKGEEGYTGMMADTSVVLYSYVYVYKIQTHVYMYFPPCLLSSLSLSLYLPGSLSVSVSESLSLYRKIKLIHIYIQSVVSDVFARAAKQIYRIPRRRRATGPVDRLTSKRVPPPSLLFLHTRPQQPPQLLSHTQTHKIRKQPSGVLGTLFSSTWTLA